MKNLGVILIITIGALLHWYSYGEGLLLTNDSHHYLSASQTFKLNFSFIDKDGHYFLFWPPLFPIILSVIEPGYMNLVHLTIYILLSLVLWKIVKQNISDPIIRLICFIFVALNVHLLLISAFLWSELIFILLVALFIEQLLQSDRLKRSFYLTMIIGFFLCLQRNAGVFVVAGAALWFLIHKRSEIKKTVLFFVLSCSGAIIWNVYVWFFVRHNHFDFSEKLFQYSMENADSIANAIINLYLPIDLLSIPLCIILFISLISLLKDELIKKDSILLIFIVTVVYLTFLLLVVTINIAGFHVDPGEGDRFISVVVPFLGILWFRSFELIYQNKKARVKTILLILLACWMIYPVGRTIKNSIQWHEMSLN